MTFSILISRFCLCEMRLVVSFLTVGEVLIYILFVQHLFIEGKFSRELIIMRFPLGVLAFFFLVYEVITN